MRASESEIPAILGGTTCVKADSAAANRWPVLSGEDETAVLNIIRNGNLSTHHVIRELEDDYRNFTGRPYALAHCNGTAALLAAFFALGLKPGDEVLVPSATFWASVLPMLWVGAVPVFCESEDERLGPDPRDMERKITGRTRAIVVVHLWGMPAKMSEIFALARRHNLRIIEDASHSHGAAWRGRPCGSLGDISVFSLQGSKLAPAGEGGILLCTDYKYFERAACLGDITRIIELETEARRFAATSFGIKTRMAPLSAAIARVQLKNLEDNNRRRNGNIEYLSHELEKLGFCTYLPPSHIKRTYFEFIIRSRPEATGMPVDVLVKALQAEGCEVSRPRYPLLHMQPFFTEGHYLEVLRPAPGTLLPEYRRGDLPKTEQASERMLKLPSFPTASRDILDQYIAAFQKVISHQREIMAASGGN